MLTQRVPLLVAVIGLFVPSPLAAEDKPDKTFVQAKEAVEAYLKAFKAEDLDAAMKACGVPFVMNDRGTVATVPDLRQEFARIFDRSDLSKLTFEVKAIGTLDGVKGKLGEKKHEAMLRAVLKDGDRVVLADADFGKRKETMAFAVTVRDGKALVVGMFD